MGTPPVPSHAATTLPATRTSSAVPHGRFSRNWTQSAPPPSARAARAAWEWRDWIVVGIGIGGLIAAHAAALDERIAGVASIEAPLSYASMVKDPGAEQPVSAILPGVLAAYEIRDVYAALAPRPLLIVNPQDARRRGVTEAEARSELASAMDTYDMLESRDSMQVVTGLGRSGLRSQLEGWLTGLAA